MKYILFIFLLVPASCFSIHAQDNLYNPDKTYPADQLKEDLNILHETLIEADPSLYRYLNGTQTDSVFNALSATITMPMTEDAFKRHVIIPAVVALRDLHFVVYPNEATETYLNEHGNYFPFDIKIVKGHAYIWRNLSTDTSIADHGRTELLSINGTDISTIINKLQSYIVADGYSVTTKRMRDLEQSFRSYYSIVYGRPDSYDISIKNYKGRPPFTVTVHVPAVKWNEIGDREKMRYAEQPDLVGLELPDDKTAILTLHTFDPDQVSITDDAFQAFIDSSFRLIHEKHIKNLVLDLRGNYGGRMNYGARMYSYLTDSAYRYIDRVEVIFPHTFPSMIYTSLGRNYLSNTYGMRFKNATDSICVWETYQWVFGQAASPASFTGKLYVLADGYTFSTTGILCSMLRGYRDNTVFIGEETGGAYEGCSGNLPLLKLPHTGLRIHFPIRKFVSPAVYHPEKNKGFTGRGILPDVEISNTIEQWINNEDAVMKKALKLAGK